ncbi:MAG: hypothetical protein GWN00_26335 [Aliifodinibius sp.]|nr:hypothetical protein [Fodinibius sp.]NIV14372.1 hypothetical protein [Fodinibius sp.]NIY28191.1 hypothetical protein [Fodinibius sp.]
MNTEAAGTYLSEAEMGRVIGGDKCEACCNYCGGNDMDSDRCDDEGDDGELCGSYSGTGAAWTCGAWGTADDNCTLSTADANCVGVAAHCYNGQCVSDDEEENHEGQSNCSD